MKTKKQTHYINQVSNPYCSNGNFMYKHNSDKTLGKSYADEKLEELRKDPEGFKKRTAKLVRETNKLAREEGYAGGWKHFAKENKDD